MPVTDDSYTTLEDTALIVGKGATFTAQGSAASVGVQTFAPNIGFLEQGTAATTQIIGNAGDFGIGSVIFGSGATVSAQGYAGVQGPRIKSTPNPSFTIGTSSTYDFSDDVDSEGAVTYSLGGTQDPSLSLNPSTGLLTYNGSSGVTNLMTLTVSDAVDSVTSSSFSIPITTSVATTIASYDALSIQYTGSSPSTASWRYKASSSSTWKTGPYPTIIGNDVYAMAWDLNDGVSYDYELTVDGFIVDTSTVTLLSLPAETSQNAADYTVTNESQLTTALASAVAGEIIEVQGTITLTNDYGPANSGTVNNWIYLRGDGEVGTKVQRAGPSFENQNSYFCIEDLAIEVTDLNLESPCIDWVSPNSSTILEGFCVRRCSTTSTRGIDLKQDFNGGVKGFVAYDNTLTGRWSWSDIVDLSNGIPAGYGSTSLNDTWDDTGIRVTGQGNSIFHNTLSGFGDSIKTDKTTGIDNICISYNENDIRFGGDDGIELDDAYSNCIAYKNRIANTYTGVSKQPNNAAPGPIYIVRNVIVNPIKRPFKLNDGQDYMRIIHNTYVGADSVNDGYLWSQPNNGTSYNLDVLNNIFMGSGSTTGSNGVLVYFQNSLNSTTRWDGNAYKPDGRFLIRSFADDNTFALAQGQTNQPPGWNGANFEDSGKLLTSFPFANGVAAFGVDYETRVDSFDPTLSSGHAAASGAVILPGYDSASHGAVNEGDPAPNYGARTTPSWFNALNQWDVYTLPNTAISDYPPSPGYEQNKTTGANVLNAYGGAAYHFARDTMYFHGGGHADYSGNEIYALGPFTEETVVMQRLTEPSPTYSADSNGAYADGLPASTHSYSIMVCDSDSDYLIRPFQSLVYPGTTPSNPHAIWRYDLTSGSADKYQRALDGWSMSSELGSVWSADQGRRGSAAYNERDGLVYVRKSGSNSRLGTYDVSTDTALEIGSDVDGMGSYCTSDINPHWGTNGYMAVISGRSGILVHDLSAPTNNYTPTVNGDPGPAGHWPFTYDSVNDCFWSWHGGSTLYKYTPGSDPRTDAWTVTTESAASSLGSYPGPGAYNRMRYIPTLHALCLADDGTSDHKIVKL